MVLALLCAPALVQASITYTVTPSGSYTVSVGSTTTVVDIYTVTYDAGPVRLLGAFVVDVGLYAGRGASDPFQAPG